METTNARPYDFARKAAQYAGQTDAQLWFALSDARASELASAGMSCESYYADDVFTIAAELRRRGAGGKLAASAQTAKDLQLAALREQA